MRPLAKFKVLESEQRDVVAFVQSLKNDIVEQRSDQVDFSTARVPVSRDGSMFHLAIFGGNKIDGSTVDPGEKVMETGFHFRWK
jgi:hypothetical protein